MSRPRWRTPSAFETTLLPMTDDHGPHQDPHGRWLARLPGLLRPAPPHRRGPRDPIRRRGGSPTNARGPAMRSDRQTCSSSRRPIRSSALRRSCRCRASSMRCCAATAPDRGRQPDRRRRRAAWTGRGHDAGNRQRVRNGCRARTRTTRDLPRPDRPPVIDNADASRRAGGCGERHRAARHIHADCGWTRASRSGCGAPAIRPALGPAADRQRRDLDELLRSSPRRSENDARTCSCWLPR